MVMKKITLLGLFIICCISMTAIGQTTDNENSAIEQNLKFIQSKQAELNEKIECLSMALSKKKREIKALQQDNGVLFKNIDSLKCFCNELKKTQAEAQVSISEKLQDTDNVIASTQSVVKNRTLWGGIITIIILFAVSLISYYLIKRIKRGTSSIDDVRKAQEALQNAQSKMQEDSIKLDNQMLVLMERQLNIVPMNSLAETDHSLALKVADEIVRIELNLSRMDASVKGYKQLTKAVERIKNNFLANGYEIIDMLGKPYNEGMKVVANFVPDGTLKNGEQIITGITKPQINYNGKMIQSAQITVSQNI